MQAVTSPVEIPGFIKIGAYQYEKQKHGWSAFCADTVLWKQQSQNQKIMLLFFFVFGEKKPLKIINSDIKIVPDQISVICQTDRLIIKYQIFSCCNRNLISVVLLKNTL